MIIKILPIYLSLTNINKLMLIIKLKKFIQNLFSQLIYLLFPLRIITFFSYIFHNVEKKKKENIRDPFVNINIFGNKFVMHLEKGSHQTKGYIETSKGTNIYEETMIFCLSEILKKIRNVVFCDIGAYISYYGLYVSSFTKDKGIVYAIESNPNHDVITKKSKEHNEFKNFNHSNSILSDKCEEYLVHGLTVAQKKDVLEYREKNILYDYYEKKKLNDILEKGTPFLSTTLDKFCSSHKIAPNILKIDVQGCEGLVLNGSKNVLENSVEYILLELHQQQFLDLFSGGIKKIEILEQLNQRGFNNYLISPFRYTKKNHDYKQYMISKKLKYLELTKENYQEVLFDRNEVDILILSIKSSININNLDCF